MAASEAIENRAEITSARGMRVQALQVGSLLKRNDRAHLNSRHA
jgi:hypothetical protein